MCNQGRLPHMRQKWYMVIVKIFDFYHLYEVIMQLLIHIYLQFFKDFSLLSLSY